MAKAKSVSLKHFTSAVDAAVAAAKKKHPKFNVERSEGIALSYLIQGIPVDERVAENLTVGEAQAFANDVAAHLGTNQPEFFSTAQAGGSAGGVVYSAGRHLIIGIPAAESLLLKE